MKYSTLKRIKNNDYALRTNSLVKINLPNGDIVTLINSNECSEVTYISVSIHSGATLSPPELNGRDFDSFSTEVVDVHSLIDGKLQTYCEVTAFHGKDVIIEDPEITGRQTATIETLDENGEWGNKVTLNEEQYKHELKSQADDENRHLGDGSIFSG